MRGKTLGIIGYGHIGSQLRPSPRRIGMRVIFFDVPKAPRTATPSPPHPSTTCWRRRRGQPARARNAGDPRMIGRAELERDEEGLLPHQRRARHRGRSRRSCRSPEHRPSARGGHGRLPGEPASTPRIRERRCKAAERDPHTPYRRLDRRGAGAYRREVARKLVEYCDTGSTMGAVNFPQVSCPRARRHPLHARPSERPGHDGRLNEVFSAGVNIAAQYLQTDAELGYVVFDAEVPGQESAALLEIDARARWHDPGKALLRAALRALKDNHQGRELSRFPCGPDTELSARRGANRNRSRG